MTGNTLTLKFKSKDDLDKVEQAKQRIVLARTVTVEPASGQSWVVAWTAFAASTAFVGRLTATLKWPDGYYVFASTVDPEATLQPPKSKNGGTSKDGDHKAAADADGKGGAPQPTGSKGKGDGDPNGTGTGKTNGNGNGTAETPPALFMLSPTQVTLGAHYSLHEGDFYWAHPDNGIGPNSIKVFNMFKGGPHAGAMGIGLAKPLSAQEFQVPRPQADAPDIPDCAPIAVAKLAYQEAVTFTPGDTVTVALMKDVDPGHALRALPDGALQLTYGPGTSQHTATYDPDSGTFKADGDKGGNGDNGGKT